jgi:molecular chaperone Hsp33
VTTASDNPRDSVLRAITDDGAFRVITIRSTNTVRAALTAQNAGRASAAFADLLTGAVLVRETMSPDLRVQAIMQSTDHKSSMVADAHPEGITRGLLRAAEDGTFPTERALLQVARTLHNGGLQQGVVEVPSSGDISGALMNYMQTSEQVLSMISVGTFFAGDKLVEAGGYIVQLLPEVGRGPLMVMTERLRDFERVGELLAKGECDPKRLLGEILYGMPFTEVGESNVSFGCNCSDERILASLASLSRADIQELYSHGEVLDIMCDYCRKEYAVQPERLRGLLESS